MGTSAIIALVLQALNAVLAEISAVRGQSGVADDVIAAQTQALLTTNDQLYAALKGLLAAPVTPKP
jgi:hypothetical protein